MGGFFQAAAAVLLAAILILSLDNKTFGSMLAMGVCAMVLITVVSYLTPVLEFLEELMRLGNFRDDIIGLLLKIAGITLITQIAALACTDVGNSSMGQALRILCSGVTLWLSLPIFQSLMELIQQMMEGI